MMKHKLMLALMFISLFITIIGALKKIMHHPGADDMLIVGMGLSVIIIAMGVYEVASSQLPMPQKTMWVLLMIFLGWIGILIYFLIGRDRVRS